MTVDCVGDELSRSHCEIEFRPVSTPEQIAAEERERGVKELMDWVQAMEDNFAVRTPFRPFWQGAYDRGMRAPK